MKEVLSEVESAVAGWRKRGVALAMSARELQAFEPVGQPHLLRRLRFSDVLCCASKYARTAGILQIFSTIGVALIYSAGGELVM